METLEARQREAARDGTDHQIVIGASGNRMGCRVCRMGRYTADFKERPEWREPCHPTREALALFEASARRRLAAAFEDLWLFHSLNKDAPHDQ